MNKFLFICLGLGAVCAGAYLGYNSDYYIRAAQARRFAIIAHCDDATSVATAIITTVDGVASVRAGDGFISECHCGVKNGNQPILYLDTQSNENMRYNAMTAAGAVSECNANCKQLCQNQITNMLANYHDYTPAQMRATEQATPAPRPIANPDKGLRRPAKINKKPEHAPMPSRQNNHTTSQESSAVFSFASDGALVSSEGVSYTDGNTRYSQKCTSKYIEKDTCDNPFDYCELTATQKMDCDCTVARGTTVLAKHFETETPADEQISHGCTDWCRASCTAFAKNAFGNNM